MLRWKEVFKYGFVQSQGTHFCNCEQLTWSRNSRLVKAWRFHGWVDRMCSCPAMQTLITRVTMVLPAPCLYLPPTIVCCVYLSVSHINCFLMKLSTAHLSEADMASVKHHRSNQQPTKKGKQQSNLKIQLPLLTFTTANNRQEQNSFP